MAIMQWLMGQPTDTGQATGTADATPLPPPPAPTAPAQSVSGSAQTTQASPIEKDEEDATLHLPPIPVPAIGSDSNDQTSASRRLSVEPPAEAEATPSYGQPSAVPIPDAPVKVEFQMTTPVAEEAAPAAPVELAKDETAATEPVEAKEEPATVPPAVHNDLVLDEEPTPSPTSITVSTTPANANDKESDTESEKPEADPVVEPKEEEPLTEEKTEPQEPETASVELPDLDLPDVSDEIESILRARLIDLADKKLKDLNEQNNRISTELAEAEIQQREIVHRKETLESEKEEVISTIEEWQKKRDQMEEMMRKVIENVESI